MMKRTMYLLAVLSAFLLFACGQVSGENSSVSETSVESEPTIFRIGLVSDINRDIWERLAPTLLEESNIQLEVEQFSDYVQPNVALSEGELDATVHQYIPYMYEFNKSSGSTLVPTAYIYMTPIGIWANDEIQSVQDVPVGAQVVVTNDPVNFGNALRHLQYAGLLELDEDAPENPDLDDIISNPKELDIITVADSQVPRSLGDAELIIVGASMAAQSGLLVEEAIYMEDPLTTPDEFKITMAIERERLGDPIIDAVVKAYQTEENAKVMYDMSKGAALPAWEDGGDPVEAYESYEASLK